MTTPLLDEESTLLLGLPAQLFGANELTEFQRLALARELRILKLENEVTNLRRQQAVDVAAQSQPNTVLRQAGRQIAKSLDAVFAPRRFTRGRGRHERAEFIQTREELHGQIRASEEQYRALFESIDEGFCIIEKLAIAGQPLDFRYIQANPAFAVQTGIHDVVGKTLRQVIPDEFEEWLLTYDAVCQTGEAIRFERVLITQGRVLELHAFPIHDGTQRCVGVSFRDITAQKRAEKQLHDNHDTFFNLIENAPFGLYIVDDKFRLRQVSAASQKVFSQVHPLLGRDFEEVLHQLWTEPFATEAVKHFRHTLETGEKYAAPNTTERRNNIDEVESYDWKIERIVLPDGQFGVVCYFYDVTERQHAQDALRESENALRDLHRRKDEFLAMLGHELRNPLASLSNAAQLLQLQQNDDPVFQKARDVIRRQVGQLSHLVDDLLEVSRITTGKIRLRLSSITLNDVVERSLETDQPLITKREHQLTVSLPMQPVRLLGDAARLEQVIVNLLTNAAKYTDEGGRINLTVSQERDEAVLRVRDTGIGISPELLPRIFDLFTQATRSLNRAEGGLGLGLSLVQQLVQLHGGTVEVTSDESKGSEFVVRLPIEAGKILPFAVRTKENVPTLVNVCRILVVDDNADAAHVMAALLEISGHVVRTVHDGPSALEMALSFDPDVVLLDIGLPGMNGLEVAHRMRQIPGLEGIVLVALTGYGQAADHQRSREAGFDHHLVKPTQLGDVQKILTSLKRV